MKFEGFLLCFVSVLAFDLCCSVAQELPDVDQVTDKAEEIVATASEKVEEIAEQVDQREDAHKASAGILKPIYLLAERFSFPAFHWIAFAVMATGVVSYSLQLVLAKLVVLSKMSISMTAILSDVLGLAISVLGLVLTTQAATENSNFTQSPAAVLSATFVGVLAGFIFYRWGQAEEVQAVEGRRRE